MLDRTSVIMLACLLASFVCLGFLGICCSKSSSIWVREVKGFIHCWWLQVASAAGAGLHTSELFA